MDQLGSRTEASPSSSTNKKKIERRLSERNRRKDMKILYSKLNSLLPNNHNSTRPKFRGEGEDGEGEETCLLERKGGRKRTCGDGDGYGDGDGSGCSKTKPPQLEVHEMDSCLEIVMTCGLENRFIFYEIIRILNEENIDVKTSNSTLLGDSMLHVIHAEIPQSSLQFGATKVSKRLKGLVNAESSSSKNELQSDSLLWDFEIDIDAFAGLIDFLE
ncbi:hypothetical protein PIB30_103064 [Stylosanthes scabra]|uniref:BHLH domain-containing protein n=1 Tax=Stylosanthes scabra TaxID=79078 RepID=A0ABU6U096_9FABA|nr:hypothetical protein [Stylosanthes scabra]